MATTKKKASKKATKKTATKAAKTAKKATKKAATVKKTAAKKSTAKKAATKTTKKASTKVATKAAAKETTKKVASKGKKAASKQVEKDVTLSISLSIKSAPCRIEDVVSGGKFLKTAFFAEVDENEERLNKKKYSESKSMDLPTVARRNHERKMDESTEELIARISQELEEEQAVMQREQEEQVCTKCGIMPVEPRYVVDRYLGYCEECAELLHLGETKEAKRMENNLGGGIDGNAAI